ncbi:hypothetical protein BDB00DRAFT_880202, partial [Zychaea mexicana]|uniref:uncharacterized protein n=1 Tax=Zychaea mexicana TaxID=64656 RepID=UPI0022FE53CC
PSQSLIFDPQDKIWATVFTEEELQEIKTNKAPELTPLPDSMNEYLAEYSKLQNLDAIVVNGKHNFHRLNQPDLHWMNMSIAKALDVLYYDYLSKSRSEADLLKHVWSIIDCCFFEGDIDITSGEHNSKSTSSRVNDD